METGSLLAKLSRGRQAGGLPGWGHAVVAEMHAACSRRVVKGLLCAPLIDQIQWVTIGAQGRLNEQFGLFIVDVPFPYFPDLLRRKVGTSRGTLTERRSG
jgi:hypothetical protein